MQLFSSPPHTGQHHPSLHPATPTRYLSLVHPYPSSLNQASLSAPPASPLLTKSPPRPSTATARRRPPDLCPRWLPTAFRDCWGTWSPIFLRWHWTRGLSFEGRRLEWWPTCLIVFCQFVKDYRFLQRISNQLYSALDSRSQEYCKSLEMTCSEHARLAYPNSTLKL